MDYKKYSLENLEKWIEDAINSSEASPQEIYNVIKNVVADNYYCYKNHTERCYELLALLNGNGNFNLSEILKEKEYYEGSEDDKILSCDKDDQSPECQKSWSDFWNEVDEKHSREYNLREAEYYDKRAKLDAEVEAIKKAGGYEWTPHTSSEYTHAKIQAASPYNDGFTQEYYQNIVDKYEGKKDTVVKWQLPVEVDGASGEYFINFPDDLLEAANLKEGDQVEWVAQGNGSYLLKKV
jgi:hypothetical protein